MQPENNQSMLDAMLQADEVADALLALAKSAETHVLILPCCRSPDRKRPAS